VYFKKKWNIHEYVLQISSTGAGVEEWRRQQWSFVEGGALFIAK